MYSRALLYKPDQKTPGPQEERRSSGPSTTVNLRLETPRPLLPGLCQTSTHTTYRRMAQYAPTTYKHSVPCEHYSDTNGKGCRSKAHECTSHRIVS